MRPRARPPTPALLAAALALLVPGGTARAADTAPEHRFVREPAVAAYRFHPATARSGRPGGWLRAVRESDGLEVEFGPRLILRARVPADLAALEERFPARDRRRFDPSTVVVDLPDASAALDLADRLGPDPRVAWAVPVSRHGAVLAAAWAPPPDDPYFDRQYPLDASGTAPGFAPFPGDLNARGAWAWHRGDGVTLAFLDDGLDTSHPDLAPNLDTALQRNHATGTSDVRHGSTAQYHGTAVAGMAVARGGNGIGISGMAPEARAAAQVVFTSGGRLVDTARLAEAFQHETGRIAVQNNSWANGGFTFLVPTAIERLAISNALTLGRAGRGVVIVRAAGNTRERSFSGESGVGDVNSDGFGNEPGAIAVASVRRDGRVASYSTPGAPVLVAAPGGEASEGSQVFTLDPVGNAGRSTLAENGPELADYLFGSRNIPGTSYSSPLVAGICALMLGANPGLHHRDVQILLALSARPTDRAEAQREPNGAGLSWSPDTGFGVPDAGEAVRRAASLSGTRPRTRLTRSLPGPVPIPDDGLAIEVSPGGGPPLVVAASPGTGRHPDDAAGPVLRLVDVGTASGPVALDLTGAAALIQRGAVPVAEAIRHAAEAGAALAVVVHNAPDNTRVLLAQTDSARIPAVLVGRLDGDAIRALLAGPGPVSVRTRLDAARFRFVVDEGMALDSVQVRLAASHPAAGHLRVTVRAPSGGISVLQRATLRGGSQVGEWWYASKRHLLEGARGEWEVAVADEAPGSVGTVSAADLILDGMAIADTDADGLDDGWERTHWGDLGARADGDEDGDGWTHAAEQHLGTDPRSDDRALVAGLAPAGDGRLRLSWPVGVPGEYAVESSAGIGEVFEQVGTARREPPEGAWFLHGPLRQRFLRVRRLSGP